MPRSRQVALAILAGVGVAGLLFYFSWSSKPSMSTAFSNLDEKDAAAVVDSLASQGVPYELAADGTAVRVPADRVDDVRLALAQEGLPAGDSVGFEIFDNTQFGATDFVQQINYQRGLEGEISRSINSIDSIDSARVHLVLPEQSLFSESQEPASASVVLKMRGAATLTQPQVNGIAHLVASAVKGLDQKNITIVDTSGTVLMDGSALAGFGASTTNLALQRSYEMGLERDLQAMLDNVLGYDKARVTVRAELDFDTGEVETTSFQDSEPFIRSQSVVEESFEGTGSGSSSRPGIDSNVPTPTADTTGPDSTSRYDRTETTTNNEVPVTTSKTTKSPGALKRLSVAVIIDEAVPEAQATALEDSIAAAAGLDTQRGDQLAVTRVPFDETVVTTPEEAEQAAAAGKPGMTDQVLGYARIGVPILALVGFFVFYRLMLRSLTKRRERWSMAPTYSIQEMPVTGTLEERVAEAQKREVSVERVATIAKQQPTAVAEIVQSWLREGAS